MATRTIRDPMAWTISQAGHVFSAIGDVGDAMRHVSETVHAPAPVVRKIGLADLRMALREGLDDLTAYRTDVFFLIFGYPIIVAVVAALATHVFILPLLFPIASGFAIIGPAFGVGLYEMSRQREDEHKLSWLNGPAILHRPAIGTIAMIGIGLAALYLIWLAVAWEIYANTMGPALPTSTDAFIADVFGTAAGWAMIVIGVVVGALFAVFAMTVSVVSLPLLVDRDVGLEAAVTASVRAVRENMVPMAAWGLIVTVGLILGAVPFLIGLIVMLPLLGHATWHLYRKLVHN